MDVIPVFFRIDEKVSIALGHIVRIEEHKDAASGEVTINAWTTDQISFTIEGDRVRDFRRAVGKSH